MNGRSSMRLMLTEEAALKPYAKHRQQALQDGGETDQGDKDLQQIRQPSIAHKPVDDPEEDRADDDGDEDVNQDQEHENLASARLRMAYHPSPNRAKGGGEGGTLRSGLFWVVNHCRRY
jgi:hypothetical protein